MLCFACLAVGLHAGEMYRIVDEKGNVVYTDKLPPSQTQKGYGVIDKQGRPSGQVAPAMTEEERAELARKKAEQEALQRAQEERLRKEDLLLQLYGSEEAIENARSSMLETTEGKRRIFELNISTLKKRNDELLKLAASGKPQTHELLRLKKELAEAELAMKKVDEEKAAVNEHFDLLKASWRIAKARRDALNPKVAPTAPQTDNFLLLSPSTQ